MKTERPKKPSKTILISRNLTFDNWDAGNYSWEKIVSWDFFVEWQKKNIPRKAFDVVMEVEIESDDYGENPRANLVFKWQEKVPNSTYTQEMKRYQKAMEKYNRL